MFPRFLIAMAAVALLGCQQRATPPVQAASSPQPAAPPPAASPVVSAEPARDPEPREPAPAAPEPTAPAPRYGPSEPAAKPTYVIPAGTRIRVRLAQTLDTRYARPGRLFAATLDEPIVVGDRVAVPKGTPFTGAVVASKRSGRLRGRAFLEITLRSFRMKGATYHVATAADTRVSGSHKKRNLVYMGGGTGAGAGVGAVAGGGVGAAIGGGIGAAAGTTTAFITGRKNLRLPVETPMVFSLRSSVAVRRG